MCNIIAYNEFFFQISPPVFLLCTLPPLPFVSTGHLQLPHPLDTRSFTLLEQETLQALQCRSVVAVLTAMRYLTSVPQPHTVSVLCLSMGPSAVALQDKCWLQEVSYCSSQPHHDLVPNVVGSAISVLLLYNLCPSLIIIIPKRFVIISERRQSL